VVLAALVALSVCASYVSILNDLTDIEDDRASGKVNRWQEKCRTPAVVLLACCVAAGAGFAFAWRNDALLLSAYLPSWAAFTLYSVPPFRLKVRGIGGVFADACGAHLFPALLALALLHNVTRAAWDIRWNFFVATWALAFGVRGILWHQLQDAAHDRKIGSRTFVCVHGANATRRLGLAAALCEYIAFAAMLWVSKNPLAGLFLIGYGFFALLRRPLLGIRLSLIEPSRTSRMAMAEYYIVLFPAAYLLTAVRQQPWALWLLLAHAVLFPRHCLGLARDVFAMLRVGFRRGRGVSIDGHALDQPRRSRYRDRASRQNPVVTSSEPQPSFFEGPLK
jgi:1,4-dihydroxy-2-naphthoate octaprenyltransferase